MAAQKISEKKKPRNTIWLRSHIDFEFQIDSWRGPSNSRPSWNRQKGCDFEMCWNASGFYIFELAAFLMKAQCSNRSSVCDKITSLIWGMQDLNYPHDNGMWRRRSRFSVEGGRTTLDESSHIGLALNLDHVKISHHTPLRRQRAPRHPVP